MFNKAVLLNYGACEMLATITETDCGAVPNIGGVHALVPSDAAYVPVA